MGREGQVPTTLLPVLSRLNRLWDVGVTGSGREDPDPRDLHERVPDRPVSMDGRGVYHFVQVKGNPGVDEADRRKGSGSGPVRVDDSTLTVENEVKLKWTPPTCWWLRGSQLSLSAVDPNSSR